MLYREGVVEMPAPAGKSEGAAKSFTAPVEIEKSTEGLGCFTRFAFAPQDRNFVNFYFDTGLTYKGLIPGRSDDTIGVAFAYAQLGNTSRNSLVEEGSVGVGAEMGLEATYQCQVTPRCIVQPDIQYIINPGGIRDLGNAFVIGGRLAFIF
jgi:porin